MAKLLNIYHLHKYVIKILMTVIRNHAATGICKSLMTDLGLRDALQVQNIAIKPNCGQKTVLQVI